MLCKPTLWSVNQAIEGTHVNQSCIELRALVGIYSRLSTVHTALHSTGESGGEVVGDAYPQLYFVGSLHEKCFGFGQRAVKIDDSCVPYLVGAEI